MKLTHAFGLIFLLSTAAYAGDHRVEFRDKYGNLAGTVDTDGSRRVERDKFGNMTGSYKQEGSQTVYRDKYGNPVASRR